MGSSSAVCRVPDFGDVFTVKCKDTPSAAFAPWGKDIHFRGAIYTITHGVLAGSFNGRDWVIETSANFVIHDPVVNQEEFPEKTVESKNGAKELVPLLWLTRAIAVQAAGMQPLSMARADHRDRQEVIIKASQRTQGTPSRTLRAVRLLAKGGHQGRHSAQSRRRLESTASARRLRTATCLSTCQNGK